MLLLKPKRFGTSNQKSITHPARTHVNPRALKKTLDGGWAVVPNRPNVPELLTISYRIRGE